MRQIVSNYEVLVDIDQRQQVPMGDSVSPKGMIFHIAPDNAAPVEVLDIGFGVGRLGEIIKGEPTTRHWSVDGIDGWDVNCANKDLFARKLYRNIWHGLAQDLPSDQISKYKIICLLDVIEHLNLETAKWLLRSLLSAMGRDAYLFVSTPLWFYPQGEQQSGDLEEHLIGVPITSMLSLLPVSYSISHPLIGGFVYSKASLDYVEFFQPSVDKGFTFEKGLNLLKAVNLEYKPGVLYKTQFH